MAKVNITKVLVANRSEIARRIIRALKKMGIDSVAIYDDREISTQYVIDADEAYPLGSGNLHDTFLNIPKVINIALSSGCDAIHPGYGFLSENTEFAKQCQKNELHFIGPSVDTLNLMGNKKKALEIARTLNIPVIPGMYGTILHIRDNIKPKIFPCLVKAAAGGGGKGMRIANNIGELEDMLHRVSEESARYFGDDEVFIEKYIPKARHIEVQILGDKDGNVIHLGERDCSVQRRYQKVIEEAPATSINQELRSRLHADAIRIAKHINYYSAGTVEFLVDENNNYYFLEMNPRIQVEHPVTELITGIDIVEQQLLIARGISLSMEVQSIKPNGHAIEARLYAEDPENNFSPSAGELLNFNIPNSDYIRVDTNSKTGDSVEVDFDPMLAKIIVKGKNRDEAINKLKTVLTQSVVHGVKHNLEFLYGIIDCNYFRDNKITTSYLDNCLQSFIGESEISSVDVPVFLAAGIHHSIIKNRLPKSISAIGPWRITNEYTYFLDKQPYTISQLTLDENLVEFIFNSKKFHFEINNTTKHYLEIACGGNVYKVFISGTNSNGKLILSTGMRNVTFQTVLLRSNSFRSSLSEENSVSQTQVEAPLSGKILQINVKKGQKVKKGERLLVIESMKMENEVCLPFDTIIKEILFFEGAAVKEGEAILELMPYS